MQIKKVMLIDDNEVDNYLNRLIMEKISFAADYMVYSSAAEALKYLKDHAGMNENLPDLIFLDVRMPQMDGFQFLQEYIKFYKEMAKQCPVVMLSSSIDAEDLKKAKSFASVLDYLNKPLRKEVFPAILSKLNIS